MLQTVLDKMMALKKPLAYAAFRWIFVSPSTCEQAKGEVHRREPVTSFKWSFPCSFSKYQPEPHGNCLLACFGRSWCVLLPAV